MGKCNSCYYLNNIDLPGSFYEVRFLTNITRALSDSHRPAAKNKSILDTSEEAGRETEAVRRHREAKTETDAGLERKRTVRKSIGVRAGLGARSCSRKIPG